MATKSVGKNILRKTEESQKAGKMTFLRPVSLKKIRGMERWFSRTKIWYLFQVLEKKSLKDLKK